MLAKVSHTAWELAGDPTPGGNGLPGALVAWFLDTVGPRASSSWPQDSPTDARVSAPLGYADATGIRVFPGTVDGSLATEPRGTSGFGYDPIFIPGGDTSQRTYAQMTSEEKNKISHRRRAVEEMRNALRLPDPTATVAVRYHRPYSNA